MNSGKSREDYLPMQPAIDYSRCPIKVSMGYLGRKWALLILRDIAFVQRPNFTELLRRNRGLTPRVLASRIEEMSREGIIEKIGDPADARKVRYLLTEKGRDVIPVLTALIQYGIRNHAGEVFEDRKPRNLEDVYPDNRRFMLGSLAEYAEKAPV